MADFSDMAGEGAVMAALPTAALLRVLREAHDYRPAAVAAAMQELQLRHASGFDITNAVDEGREAVRAHALADELPLPTRAFIFWMLLPWLVATPLGARAHRRYSAPGHSRRLRMFLEAVIIGFLGYFIVVLLVGKLVH